MQKAVGCDEFDILNYCRNTDEWSESNANLEEKKKELSNQVELRTGCSELGEKSSALEKTNFGKPLKKLTDKK